MSSTQEVDNRPKASLSQPMAGISEEEIDATRDRAVAELESRGFRVINTLFTDEWYSRDAMKARGVEQIGLCFLAKALESMSHCKAVLFCKGWEKARGCVIEHMAALAYGVECIYEDKTEHVAQDSYLNNQLLTCINQAALTLADKRSEPFVVDSINYKFVIIPRLQSEGVGYARYDAVRGS